MGGFFIKLDWNWRDDPKVVAFEELCGKAALVDLIGLFVLESEFYGCIDLRKAGVRGKMKRSLRMTDKQLDAFLGNVAACELIDAEAYRTLSRVGSERSMRDGQTRRSRVANARKAGEASARKREASGKDVENKP